jgi:hypothetical protein
MPMVYAEPPVNPPRNALAANAVSAITSGTVAATGMPGVMVLVWSLVGVAQDMNFRGTLHNLGLAVTLMLVAVVFAGLALALTALFGRETYFKAATGLAGDLPMVRKEATPGTLLSYTSLTLLGLAVDALALGLLVVQPGTDGFRLAAAVGTVLQILALAVGIRRHLRAA